MSLLKHELNVEYNRNSIVSSTRLWASKAYSSIITSPRIYELACTEKKILRGISVMQL